MNDRELYWPRGRTLGGSSAINAMIYIRGHPYDYDHWESLGNDGWAYENVLPYFNRGEAFGPGDGRYHGTAGELSVSSLRSPNDLSATFVDAAAEVGYPRNDDFNGARRAGVGHYHLTQKKGTWHSAADAYLKPAMDRPNLTVETGAHVTGVRFEGDRATGVEYRQDDRQLRADAVKEVVLSGGAVDSP